MSFQWQDDIFQNIRRESRNRTALGMWTQWDQNKMSAVFNSILLQEIMVFPLQWRHKQRVLTPGHQGWNDLHSLCRLGMEYYLLNNNNNNNNNKDNNNDNNNNNSNNNYNNNNKMMMMMMMMRMLMIMTMIIIIIIITTITIIMIIRMVTMMIIGTTTIMIMIIIITTTLTMTIMRMIMIKTAQTPCQSLYKDRRI